ncbi:MAG: hypothetical protein LBN11_00690, partial [Tannerella sp.]|nr:hypothetical protein [Tannerella sp.]
MKQKILIAIAACMMMPLFAHGQTQITTAEELQAIGDDANSLRGRYILANDIEVENWTPIGSLNALFLGTFDGDGHTITIRSIGDVASEPYRFRSAIKIQGEDAFLIGLFGSIGRRSLVQNVRIAGEIGIEGDVNVVAGGIAGTNFGQILNCISEVSLDAKNTTDGDCFVGGITGINNGFIRNCYATGNIAAFGGTDCYVGGLAGVNDFDAGVIQFCYASGDISANENNGDSYVGGIAGICVKGGVVQYGVAFNSAISTDGLDEAHHFTGRIVGKNLGRIGGNYSSQEITLSMDKTRENDRSVFTSTAMQDRLWWGQYARYAFGEANARPWTWNETAGRPTLFWENGETTAALPATRGRGITAALRNEVKEIYTVEDLQSIGESLSALQRSYVLMSDLTVENWTPIGVIGEREAFMGVFDGNGYTITLSSLAEGQKRRLCLYGGVFGEIGRKGVVKNLCVRGDLEFSSGDKSMFIGAIAAANNGTIECCISELNITADGGQYTKGNKWTSFGKGVLMSNSNRAVMGFFEWGIYAGDIAGLNYGTVRNCYSTGNMQISGKGYKSVGGIAGGNDNLLINCYATGNLTAEGDGASRYTGGIAGINNQTIENCVALNGELTARGKSGGSAPSGSALEWNINIALGIAGRDYKQLITNAFYRDDMIFNREDTEGNDQKKSLSERTQKKGKAVAVEATENQSWWQSIGNKNKFRFGGDA